jgi:hypothetical protein
MKRFNSSPIDSSLFEDIQTIWIQLARQKVPRTLFLLLCLNLIVAPAVQAATGNQFSQTQAYALGILGLATVVYSIYLFVVMFQPERF